MAVEAKKYKVDIFGESLTIVSDESEEHVFKSASLVDAIMKEISEKAKSSDGKKIAIFTALQIASKLAKLESEVKEYEKLVKIIDQELPSLSQP